MKYYIREIKFICIALALLIFITFVPNAMLKNWIFILFVFADFYITAALLKKYRHKSSVLDSALIGMSILMVVSIILNQLGF